MANAHDLLMAQRAAMMGGINRFSALLSDLRSACKDPDANIVEYVRMSALSQIRGSFAKIPYAGDFGDSVFAGVRSYKKPNNTATVFSLRKDTNNQYKLYVQPKAPTFGRLDYVSDKLNFNLKEISNSKFFNVVVSEGDVIIDEDYVVNYTPIFGAIGNVNLYLNCYNTTNEDLSPVDNVGYLDYSYFCLSGTSKNVNLVPFMFGSGEYALFNIVDGMVYKNSGSSSFSGGSPIFSIEECTQEQKRFWFDMTQS